MEMGGRPEGRRRSIPSNPTVSGGGGIGSSRLALPSEVCSMFNFFPFAPKPGFTEISQIIVSSSVYACLLQSIVQRFDREIEGVWGCCIAARLTDQRLDPDLLFNRKRCVGDLVKDC
jgi:hypothetical protein